MRDYTNIAVFARNWPDYLEEAVALTGRSRDTRRTYQSKQRWVSAAAALSTVGPRVIYFAEIEGDSEITHIAELVEVLVDPTPRSRATRRLLADRGLTKGEPLWGKTLYAIRSCWPLDKPFSMSKLRLASDGQRLSRDYRYSYALVKETSPAA